MKKWNQLYCQHTKEEEKEDKKVWDLDAESSNHMCGSKRIYFELDESMTDNVTFGDSSKVPLKAKRKNSYSLKNEDH